MPIFMPSIAWACNGFLYMMLLVLFTEVAVFALVDRMPEGTGGESYVTRSGHTL